MYNIKTSEKSLKFGDVEVNKKEFHASKQSIALNLVDINQIVIFDKLKHNDKGSKCFIGYEDDDIIRPLCIVLPQMKFWIVHLFIKELFLSCHISLSFFEISRQSFCLQM